MFLIQAGHQSSTQISEALPSGRADGVIWSPGDEGRDSLALRMQSVDSGLTQALDPQLYVGTLSDANPKKLEDHGLFEVPITPRQFSAPRLSATIERILDYEASLPCTHIIAPTVGVSSMSDRSAQVALNLTETSLDLWADSSDERPLLLSVAIELSLLTDVESVNALLDELTAHEDAGGFYLMFEIDPRFDAERQAALLSEAMYIVYTLGTTQGAEVWVGYSGINGYLYRAVGAHVMAAGWFQKQQWWSVRHWAPSGGGRTPRPRVALESLMHSLLADTELQVARTQRRDPQLGNDLLQGSGTIAATMRDGGQPALDRGACASQLFDVCQALDRRIVGAPQVDLERIQQELSRVAELYERLASAGVQLEGPSAGDHVGVWGDAIQRFAERAGIDLT